ncbi:hypothetical protein C8J56DRAFT_1089933 [Mycena floridula]|nr:hypothetical protein C8J56DRAFT_1089933 [Mycena floridula]
MFPALSAHGSKCDPTDDNCHCWPYNGVDVPVASFRYSELHPFWDVIGAFLDSEWIHDGTGMLLTAPTAAELNQAITLHSLCLFFWQAVPDPQAHFTNAFCNVLEAVVWYVSPLAEGSAEAQQAYSAAVLLITSALEEASLKLESGVWYGRTVEEVSNLLDPLLEITDDAAAETAQRVLCSPVWWTWLHHDIVIPSSWLENPELNQIICARRLIESLEGWYHPRLPLIPENVMTLAGLHSTMQIKLTQLLKTWLTEIQPDDLQDIPSLFRLLGTLDEPNAVIEVHNDSDALGLDAIFHIKDLGACMDVDDLDPIILLPQSAAPSKVTRQNGGFSEARVQCRSWDKDKLPEQREAPRVVMKEQRCKETKETIQKDQEKGKKTVPATSPSPQVVPKTAFTFKVPSIAAAPVVGLSMFEQLLSRPALLESRPSASTQSQIPRKIFRFGASKDTKSVESSTKLPTQGSKATSSSNEAASTFQFGGTSHSEFLFKFSLTALQKKEAQNKVLLALSPSLDISDLTVLDLLATSASTESKVQTVRYGLVIKQKLCLQSSRFIWIAQCFVQPETPENLQKNAQFYFISKIPSVASILDQGARPGSRANETSNGTEKINELDRGLW